MDVQCFERLRRLSAMQRQAVVRHFPAGSDGATVAANYGAANYGIVKAGGATRLHLLPASRFRFAIGFPEVDHVAP